MQDIPLLIYFKTVEPTFNSWSQIVVLGYQLASIALTPMYWSIQWSQLIIGSRRH